MADHQRIHPVSQDPEATPPPKASAPLFPQKVSRSEEKADPESQRYPPFQGTVPHSYSNSSKRKCCKRCLCWTVSLIILEVIVVAILAAIIYFAFKPKLPKYSVDSMRITQFNVGNDNSLSATFDVNITARNPNKKIGIYYEGGSHLSVFYDGNQLCEGSLPKFYQGHRNTTVMQVSLTGQTQNGRGLVQSLQAQQQTGTIPLNLRAKVPVRIKLGGLKLMKWKFLVKCRVNVDSLTPDNTIKISDSSCKFRFRF